jgi:two-component system, sensor histidine kinase RegB
MLEDMVGPLRGSDVEVEVDAKPSDRSNAPVFRRNPAISYGLGNLLENAIDFASSRVDVKARWSANNVTLSVSDDGPGFDQTIFDRLGDPFVTTRPGYGDGFKHDEGEHEGMGLGLFIAKTLLERTGASVVIANRKAPETGAMIQINWPRAIVDMGK